MTDQAIIKVEFDAAPSLEVGRAGVTRIEAYDEPGMYSSIPYVRVWSGDEKVGEFCKHNVVGIYYAQSPKAEETAQAEHPGNCLCYECIPF